MLRVLDRLSALAHVPVVRRPAFSADCCKVAARQTETKRKAQGKTKNLLPPHEQPKRRSPVSALFISTSGMILGGIGFVMLLYALFIMQTVPPYREVHNIGLMHERLVWVLVSLVAGLSGTLIWCTGLLINEFAEN